jgi:hypothetical protein
LRRSADGSSRPSGEWKGLLRVDTLPQSKVSVLGRADGEGCFIEGVEVSVPNVTIPMWRFVPKQRSSAKVMLVLEPRGRNGHWREDELYHHLAARAGWTVCAFDVRGIGDLTPEVGRGNPFYARPHSEEEAWAWASLMLGRPLLGQRISDVLAVAAGIRASAPQARLVLASTGHTAVPATLAAAFDPRIDLVYTVGGLESWASLVESPDYTEPFANFLPGVLRRTDLPEIRKALGVRLRRGRGWDVETLGGL